MAKASDNLFPKVILVEAAAPATPAAGTVITYAKADGLLYSKDDAGAETALGGSGTSETYSAWTPALTAATTNPTLGTGSSVRGRYFRNGNHVSAKGVIAFGTSGSAAGSGEYRISLPVNALTSSPNIYSRGMGHIYDASTGAVRVVRFLATVGAEGTTVRMFVIDGSTSVTHNSPWTWAENDQIDFELDYEAAP